ncbi:selenium cofactor biosynthesis protein YqeC [uncultured Parolsenella sp.]|uniref:selenium cofactor biosynthesis protein YqeC n=1 Tax=uncultured Parolsenella sp. TaxID=2083008 RepID=UPI0025E217DE|nr:selenium cofactor biosynthesis protein YqeC [uncultured Parolsenella sp.]
MDCYRGIKSTANVPDRQTNGTIWSVIGGGGKTTLLRSLADELVAEGKTVILATTTHFLPFSGIDTVVSADEFEVARQVKTQRVICVGTPAHEARNAGKLAPSRIAPQNLASLADFVLVEADGSRHMPVKAHSDHEPVIPGGSDLTIMVIGASAFGRPVAQSVHRAEIFCENSSCEQDDAVTPELLARHLATEARRGVIDPNLIIVNQAESPETIEAAHAFNEELIAMGMKVPMLAGSIRRHDLAEIQ